MTTSSHRDTVIRVLPSDERMRRRHFPCDKVRREATHRSRRRIEHAGDCIVSFGNFCATVKPAQTELSKGALPLTASYETSGLKCLSCGGTALEDHTGSHYLLIVRGDL